MLGQTLVVALLVVACSAYAVWALLPAAGRRAVSRALLRLPLPAAWAKPLRKHSVAASGCACDGCDRAGAKPAVPAVQTISFQPRPKGRGSPPT